MSLRSGRRDEKGLPPLPAQHQDARYNTFDDVRVKETDSGTWAAFLSESPLKEGRSQSKGKGKAPPPIPIPIPLPSLFDDFAPLHSPSSPAKSTSTPTSTRQRFASASTSNLNQFDGPSSSRSYQSRYHPGGSQFAFAPPSPSIASQHSLANSTSTAKAGGKRSMFNSNTKTSSKSAPSFRSSQTMPEMIAYNDVDQWGVGAGSGPQSPRSPKKEKSFNQSPEGVGRKGSSSKILARGLSRGLTRMGSVMKRSTSSAKMGVEGDENRRRRVNGHSIVREEMGEEWERVDIHKEVTEGDTSITRPFNVEHSLHVSPDLDNLPPAWLEALKAQGLSEEDLLLIAAARQKAGQRPMLRIVKGSLPPQDEVSTPTPLSQARSRGLSTPAHLIINNSNHHSTGEAEKPVLDKRFSWERSPITPTGSPKVGEVESPHTPLRAFRQSLQKPQSPAPAATQRLARTPLGGFISNRDIQEENDESGTEETPKKTKRWSDQLRGFQSSFAGLGGDDNWGDSLTSALALDGGVLQTVHESNHSRRESESGNLVTASHEVEEEQSPEVPPKTTVAAQLVSPRIDSSSTIRNGPTSPTSPTTREARIRRKPVPSIISPPISPSTRRHSNRSIISQPGPKSPTSPKVATGERPAYPRSKHSRTRSAGLSQSLSQSNDSDFDHDLRTPSPNEHFPLSTSQSADLVLPPLPRSISEESHWATQMTKPAEHAEQWLHFTPPRPDPRLSLPATARYTESSPPSRSHTPEIEYSEASHYPISELADDHSSPHETQLQAQAQESMPISRTTPSPKSPRSPTSPRHRRDKDPLSRLDNAPRSERASIALSMLSDPRSSLGSIRSSYPHEARIMKAFMREPGEGLGGLRESDGERDSSDQASGDGHDQRDIGRLEDAAIITSDGSKERQHDESPRSAHSMSHYTRNSKQGSHRSKSSLGSSSSETRSTRSNERGVSTYSPHPFAYQSEADACGVHEREDDALSALDDAAREIARQRARVASVSSGNKMEGKFEDASIQV